ncbi:MAG: hypothetical protein JWM21_2892 [Acidobacteria bacterium]|nr:hypothetical protein [Acidobacteriota bacterium]
MPGDENAPVLIETDPKSESQNQIGVFWASLLGLYLVVMSITLSYMLYNLWPPQVRKVPPAAQTNTRAAADTDSASSQQNDTKTAAEEVLPPVILFRGALYLHHSVEVRLLLLAMLAGALGSFIHAGTSFADYVGNRKLGGNWIWWYLLRPFIGMTLALIFYFVVRGGFISPSAGGGDMNPFGIAAMAGLVGMFSKQAIDKLNEVFNSLFGSKGDEKRGDKLVAPKITAIKPNSGPTAGGTTVVLSGSGFASGAKVMFGGVPGTSVAVDASGNSISAITPKHNAGAVDVDVINLNNQKVTLPSGFTYQDQ